MNNTQAIAIANADTRTSAAGLPTYSELVEALRVARQYLNHPGGASGNLWFEANEKARIPE